MTPGEILAELAGTGLVPTEEQLVAYTNHEGQTKPLTDERLHQIASIAGKFGGDRDQLIIEIIGELLRLRGILRGLRPTP